MTERDDIVASWNANAGAWTRLIRAGGVESRQLVTDQAIVDAIRATRPRRMLDIGCGEGWLVRRLALELDLAVGIDAAPDLIARARAADPVGQYHLSSYARIAAADPAAGILPTGRFDTIAANFALLDDDPALAPVLEQLARLAAPDGRLVIQTLHPPTLGGMYRAGWRTEDFDGFGGDGWQPMKWYFRTIADWIDLVSAHWRLVRISEPIHPGTGRPASLLITAKPL